jgi:hypothetical protein
MTHQIPVAITINDTTKLRRPHHEHLLVRDSARRKPPRAVSPKRGSPV